MLEESRSKKDSGWHNKITNRVERKIIAHVKRQHWNKLTLEKFQKYINRLENKYHRVVQLNGSRYKNRYENMKVVFSLIISFGEKIRLIL